MRDKEHIFYIPHLFSSFVSCSNGIRLPIVDLDDT